MNARTLPPSPDNASSLGDGHVEIERARALVARLSTARRRSTAEMLLELRRAFPNSPLAVRVRALDALRGR